MAAQQLVEYTSDGLPYGIHTLITEAAGPCSVDTRALFESTTKGWVKELADGRYRVFAKAQHCGVKNRNGRIYPTETWAQHLREGCGFMRKIGGRGVIGHLEHPDDGKSKMPLAAIVVTEAKLDESTGEIWIVFETMSTPPGRVVEAYVRDRVRFGLSSRGNGSVVNEVWQELGERVDVVQADYEPITWDVVIDESTPGAEVPASLREAVEGLHNYIQRLTERSGGDEAKAKQLLREDTQKAMSEIDCAGGVCKCQIVESTEPEMMPPSGYSRYLLAFEDGSGHYRAYQGTTGQWEVWLHPHNLSPERLGTKIPTLAAAQGVAENHYSLVLAGGAVSAQQQAANSNAIGMQARSPGMAGVPVAPAPQPQVVQPNIGGMAGMMGRYSGPVGPGPTTSQTPKVVLSFESLQRVRPQWQAMLTKLQEQWQDIATLPYSGTVVAVEGKASDILGAIEASGMSGAVVTEAVAHVFTPYENPAHAVAHVKRVLANRGLDKFQTEAVARISEGRVTEDEMAIRTRGRRVSSIDEYAPDKSAPGGMAGGDTVPDDDEEVGGGPTSSSRDSISDRPSMEDPEDLDLDLDVNESGLGYDYAGETYRGGVAEMDDYDMDDDGMDMDDEYEMEGSARMPMDYAGIGEMDFDPDDPDYDPGMPDEPMENVMGLAYESQINEISGKNVRGQQKAVFGQAFGKGKKAEKARKKSGYAWGAFRWNNAVDNNTSPKAAQSGGRRVKTKAQKAASKKAKKGKGKKMSGKESVTFTRVGTEGPLGAVRVWMNENRAPSRYEFYNSGGILEAVTDVFGNIIHAAINEAEFDGIVDPREVWETRSGKQYRAADIVQRGIDEEELKARHGGKTGVATKGNEYMGKQGPEYSMPTMNKPGDRGQEGDAGKPGDYHMASEEGDGEHVKKGTMHGGASESYVSSLEDENSHLREKLAFLESELARYEDIVQEQHEVIREADEARERETLNRYRAEAIAQHPELAIVEKRLLKCESLAELQDEIGSCISLVETVRPAPAPAPEPQNMLVEDVNPRNGISSSAVMAVPTGPLNESLGSPFVNGSRNGTSNPIVGVGDVASRVASHRRRRRRRR